MNLEKLNYALVKLLQIENTLETSGEDGKTTLETSGEDEKNTLETSGEDPSPKRVSLNPLEEDYKSEDEDCWLK